MTLAKAWLSAAKDDLILIEEIKENKDITNMVAFHAQQAIEKSLKAVLESRGEKVPRTHKLQQLFDLAKIELEFDDTVVQELDELYVESRYPGEFGLLPNGKPNLEDALKFYEFALCVFNKVLDMLGVNKNELI